MSVRSSALSESVPSALRKCLTHIDAAYQARGRREGPVTSLVNVRSRVLSRVRQSTHDRARVRCETSGGIECSHSELQPSRDLSADAPSSPARINSRAVAWMKCTRCPPSTVTRSPEMDLMAGTMFSPLGRSMSSYVLWSSSISRASMSSSTVKAREAAIMIWKSFVVCSLLVIFDSSEW